MFTHTEKEDNFLVTSPTYKILYQSTMPVFDDLLGGYGKYDRKNELFKMHNGGTVYFRTGQNPDSVVGITKVRHILADEAGLYSRYFFDNIQGRSSIAACPITIVTSPYSLNWLYTDYIKKWKNSDQFIHSLCHVLQARSDENPYFPKGEYELKQQTMDSRRFNMIYGGNFDKAEGLVYDIFMAESMGIESIKLPVGTRFFGGIDWGFTDPTVFKVRAVTESGMHYSVDEVFQGQMHQSEILDHAARLKMLWGIEKFYADPSRPDHISFLNSHGITTIPADNDIEKGIEAHYELIKTGYYQIFRKACPYTLDEYESYHYPAPIDLKPDQNQKQRINIPVDQNNHAMDAERYITMMTKNIGYRKNVIAQENSNKLKAMEVALNQNTMLDKLKKRRRKNADL
jgi:PBSX family phage terminase large subunit